MKSIRKKLLISILAVVTFVTLLLAVSTYFSVRMELDELYDENMKQVATVLAETGLEDERVSTDYKSSNKTLKGEQEFLIQVWRNGRIEYTSHPAINFPLQNKNGFGNIIFEKGEWRFYRITQGRDTIQIAQNLHKRHSVVAEIYHVLVVPIIIQLPVLAGLIWLLIGYGLQPLARISNLIQKRTASFLDPLPGENVPIEIDSIVAALNDLLARLKLALEVQRRFTADAAHELRTPLTAVRLQLDLLQRAQGRVEREEALQTLERGVNRSIRLTQQLLELARQEPETTETKLESVDLTALAAEMVENILPLNRQKNINIQKKLEHVFLIEGDAPKLSVMIENLLHNAILYTGPGGTLKISVTPRGDKILLDVADNGIGIAENDKGRVFDRFYRVPGAGATGSGLGLSIVRTIADLHGANIEILPGLQGRGTTFRIAFNAI